MKNLFSLLAFVLFVSVNAAFAQSTDNKSTVATEQTVSKDAPKACCASHGAKASAKDDAAGMSCSHASAKSGSCCAMHGTASADNDKAMNTKHEHAGKTCDPAHCTEADKKACTKAHGKSCCQGMATAEDKKETPKP